MMNLAIIGMGGVGRVIAKSAALTGKFDRVTLADLETGLVENALEAAGSGSFNGQVLDAADFDQVLKLAQEADILINATIPRFNLVVMKACLAGRCHYIDLACETLLKAPGRVDISEQLALDKSFHDAGLLALCGIGIDPGCSNIFARYLADGMDSVEEVLVRDADVSCVEGYDLALYFSPDTFIDECCSEPPLYFAEGKFVTGEPLQVLEEFDFPPPMGRVKVYGVSHEEVWTIPRYIDKGIVKCNFGYGLSDELIEMMRVLRALRLDSPDPIDVKGRKVAPRDVVTALLPKPLDLAGKVRGHICVGTLVRGLRDGRPAARFMYNMVDHQEAYEKMKEQGTSYQTGIPAALAADLLAEGVIATRGAVPPEALAPAPFIERLPAYGLEIKIVEI